jgi:nucleoside-diphosphate-sugar epimerase
MDQNATGKFIIGKQSPILITGAAGFIGSRVVDRLLEMGFGNLRCLVRSTRSRAKLESRASSGEGRVEVVQGNLLSREVCFWATRDAEVIFHLAAGRGEKSYPDAFLNSVVTTRNLMEASLQHGCLRRFVNISSFSVYSNQKQPRQGWLDETSPVESRPELRGDAYTFAKTRQDQIVSEYGCSRGLPYVTIRPGHVYGPGNEGISARVGVDSLGIFLHLGGANAIPLTYVDNCAEAIALAGLKSGVDGEVFNVVDDDLPSSRQFLRQYKNNVKPFTSVYLPPVFSYLFCWLWETSSAWSEGQLPPAFNRRRWHAFWKRTRYSNAKIKERLGWAPRIATADGLCQYFDACRERMSHA